VFPGSQLLSVPAIERQARAADRVAGLGFDEIFRRLWELYLAYCEAGFRAGFLDVWQFALQAGEPGDRPPRPGR
jgi:cyclopropane-fatty-acyl-phospholipid synthase